MTKEVLKELLNLYLKKETSYDFSNVNLNEIYKNACQSGIGVIIAYTILKYKLAKDETLYMNDIYKANIRNEEQSKYQNKIKEILENNNINFIFLKGKTLGKYYEEEYLRQSSDIDIIVEKGTYKIALAIFLDKLGFKCDLNAKNEATLHYKNLNVDLHSMFTQDDNEKESIFNEVKYDLTHELSNEYKYIYSLYHAYKHIDLNYISIQYILDLYYLRLLDLDYDFINKKINEMKLDKFNDMTVKLINVLFNNEESNEKIDRYINYVFSMANDLGVKNMTLVHNAKSDRVLLKRIFPSTDEMIRQYPELKNNKTLIPIYYVKRIIDRSSHGHFVQAKNEIRNNIIIDKEKVLETKELLKDLGIYE